MKIIFEKEDVLITKKQFEIMVRDVIKTKEFTYEAIEWDKFNLLSIDCKAIDMEVMTDMWNYLWQAIEDEDYPTNY